MATFSPCELAVDAPQAVEVEQALGGMLPRPVTGVDHRGVGVAGGHARRPHPRVAHDDDVRPVALQGQDGVLEALPLGHAGRRPLDVDHVGREPLAGQLEGRLRPRGRLQEHVDDGAAPQSGHLLDGARRDLEKAVAQPEKVLDLGCGEIVDGDEVHVGTLSASQDTFKRFAFLRIVSRPGGDSSTVPRARYSSMSTSSAPSVSTRRTTTCSLRLVGTFLPTKSGRIGRSRCPRSTSTASRTDRGRP